MREKRTVRKIVTLVLLVAWLVVAFIGYRLTHADSAGGLKTITIGYQAGDEFDISKTRGEFAKKMKAKGYKVKFKEFSNGSAEMQALASGSIDYARTGDTPGVTALASGTKLTYIAAGADKANGSGILVKNDSGIDSLSDLKGKTIAYTKGTSSEYMLRMALKKAASVAYNNGEVDAWANWDPATSQAEVTGNSKLLVNGKTLGVNNRSYLMASTSFAEDNEEASRLIIKYANQDMQWANKHKSKVIKMMAKKLKLSTKVVTKMVNRRSYSWEAMTKATVKEEQEIADLFYQAKVITKKVDISDHVQYLK